MLYWMAMGYFPQDAEQKKKKTIKKGIKIEEYQFLHFPIDIHPGLEYLLRKMLKLDEEDRIKAEEILEDTWIKPKCFK